MKYCSLILLLLLISCGKKEDILLPKSNVTVVSEIVDHSPIYLFFRTKAKDTLIELNKKNEIISTNWIFNIDKRLPLRLVIPEVIKLQEKKRKEVAHKNEAAKNYYSYADSIHKNLAFLPFTEVVYQLEKPKSGSVVFFDKNNEITVNNVVVKREELAKYLSSIASEKSNVLQFCFAKEMTYGSYLQNEIFIQSSIINKEIKEEFVY
jgi:hypothetical protein